MTCACPQLDVMRRVAALLLNVHGAVEKGKTPTVPVSAAAVATSREDRRWQACDYSPHYGRWRSLLQSCSGIARREGKLTDWVPVLVVALVVVCVTAYLLLDPKFRAPKR
jgi:hypothetical protein